MSRRNGFTLPELLIALVLTSLIVSGVIGFFVAQKRVARQAEISASVDDSLRIGLMRISDQLRNVGYGAPASDYQLWVPWVAGFTTNPRIIDGASGAPDAIEIALCRSSATSTLNAVAARETLEVSLQDATLIDTERRRLINIGGIESAHVIQTGTAIGIDTDPTASGVQGLVRKHFAGTPICRVDVMSFAVDTDNERLTIDDNSGDGPADLLDDIADLQVDMLIANRQYRITLTARSRDKDPGTGEPVTRSASTLVTVRN